MNSVSSAQRQGLGSADCLGTAMLGVCILASGCRLSAPTPDSSVALADPSRPKASGQTIGPYHITCRPAYDDLLVELRCRGRLLQRIRDEQLLSVGFRTNRNATDVQCALADLNRDQQPVLVLCTAPPGSRWGRTWVFTPTHCAATVRMGDAAPLFEDVNRDGGYELITYDPTFEYWHAGGANSLRPGVILAWREGYLKPAAELMSLPRPSQAELDRRLAAAREREGSLLGAVPIEVFREALELMYGGQEDSGWELIRMAQKSGDRIAEEVVKEFRAKRDSSRDWRALRAGRKNSKGKP